MRALAVLELDAPAAAAAASESVMHEDLTMTTETKTTKHLRGSDSSSRRLQTTFNSFKSYANAKVRPPQYSANRKKSPHSIDEYLTTTQLMMKAKRNAKPDASNGFTGNFDGYKAYKQEKAGNPNFSGR